MRINQKDKLTKRVPVGTVNRSRKNNLMQALGGMDQ